MNKRALLDLQHHAHNPCRRDRAEKFENDYREIQLDLFDARMGLAYVGHCRAGLFLVVLVERVNDVVRDVDVFLAWNSVDFLALVVTASV